MRSLSRDTWLMYTRVRAARISRRGGNEFGCIGARIELRDEWTSRMVCRRGGEKKEEWRETLGIQWSRADFLHPVDVTRGRNEPEYLQRS